MTFFICFINTMWSSLDNDTLLVYCPKNDEILLTHRTVLALDFDHTLVCQKSGKTFPTDADDWKPLYDGDVIKNKLTAEYNLGKIIVIFTNQSGVEKKKITLDMLKTRLQNFINYVGLPIWVFAALSENHYRKPSSKMWDEMLNKFNDYIQNSSVENYGEKLIIRWDVENSTFVGDAAGRLKGCDNGVLKKRKKDFSCSDRKFADNIGVKFKTPEEFFLGHGPPPEDQWEWGGFDPKKFIKEYVPINIEDKLTQKPKKKVQEMIILVGPPSSGKSTFCKNYFPTYTRINRDTLKTKAKCLKAAKEALKKGESVIIDNTSPSSESRKEYIDLVKQNVKIQVRCIVLDVEKDLALHLNQLRVKMSQGVQKKLPTVSYNVFYKQFEKPDKKEGFTSVVHIPFRTSFADNEHLRLFMERS